MKRTTNPRTRSPRSPLTVGLAALALIAPLACGGGGGGGGSAGDSRAPIYLTGDVRFVDVNPAGFVTVRGQGGQLDVLALGQLFSSAELELGFETGKIPPLPPPLSFEIRSGNGDVFIAVDPGVAFQLEYLPQAEAVGITTSVGVHLLIDAADIVEGPTAEPDGVRFRTSRRGGADRLFDSVAFADGRDSALYVAITNFGIDADEDLVAEGLDCNDGDATVSPRALEIPLDGVDQNCDGLDIPDLDLDGFPSDEFQGGTDCDDGDFFVNPGVAEVIGDAIDNDCDGARSFDDDDDGSLRFVGGSRPSPDCDDDDAAAFPGAPEIVGNGKDNNCNGIVPPGRFVALGDSVTEGVGDDPARAEAGYPPRLERRLGLASGRVVNRGVGGEDAFEGGNRVDSVLRAEDPDAVIVLYGANDSLRTRSAQVFISDIEFIVNEALDLDVEPILVQVTEVCCGRADLVMYPGGLLAWNDLIFEYNLELEALASRLGLVFVRLNEEFRMQPGGIVPLLADGLHPNADGYDIFADLLTEILEGPDF